MLDGVGGLLDRRPIDQDRLTFAVQRRNNKASRMTGAGYGGSIGGVFVNICNQGTAPCRVLRIGA